MVLQYNTLLLKRSVLKFIESSGDKFSEKKILSIPITYVFANFPSQNIAIAQASISLISVSFILIFEEKK